MVIGSLVSQVADEVADQRGDHDDRAAHGRRAALGLVRRRALLPDQLAVAAPAQHPDGQRRAEQRQHQATPAVTRMVFTRGRLPGQVQLPGQGQRHALQADRVRRLDQHHVTGPRPDGRPRRPPRPRRAPAAARRARTASALAPARIGAASSPTTISPARPAAAAAGPPARAARSAWSPSSVIWPSTANARPPRAIAARRRQRRPHRLRVGVVGVVDDGDPVRAPGDLHPPPAPGHRRGQPGRDGGQRHAELAGQRGGGQRVADVVLAVQPQLDRRRAVPR